MSAFDLLAQRAFAAGANASLLATALLGFVWVWLRLARNSSASFRALVWTVALTVTLALPAVLVVVPGVSRTTSIDVAPSAVVTAPVLRAGSDPVAAVKEPASVVKPAARPAPRLEWRAALPRQFCRLVVAVWLGGAGFFLGRFVFGNVLLHWRRRRADPSQLSSWREPADYASRQLGVADPLCLVPDERTITPTVWAGRVPTIFVPLDSDWSDERKRVVLLHEFAHIKRGDTQALWLKQLVAALYWFHPVVLFGIQESNVACEQACDDMVLNAGVPSTDYATHLLEISAELPETACTQAVMSILGTQSLERRVVSILCAKVPRGAPHPLVWAVAGMAAAPVAMALVAARPFEPRFATAPIATPPSTARAAAQPAPVSENSARTLESAVPPAASPAALIAARAEGPTTVTPTTENPVGAPADSLSPANSPSPAHSNSDRSPAASLESDRGNTPAAPTPAPATPTPTLTSTSPSTSTLPNVTAAEEYNSGSNAPNQTEAASPVVAPSVAVVQAPAASPTLYWLNAGTRVWLIHTADLSSATATPDAKVELMLAKDLTVGDAVVAKAGASAFATITHVKKAKLPGRPGAMELRLDYLQVGDRTVKLKTTAGGTNAVVEYRSPYSLKWPMGLLRSGFDIDVPTGTGVVAYIAENVALPPQP